MADPLAPNDLDLPAIGMGCWSFAGGDYWGDQDVGQSIATVNAALDAGITFFDTAENYTGDHHSEDVLGQALMARRDEALIATKVAKPHLAPADVAAACEASLERLRTDHIDLYQIHWPNPDVPLAETIGAVAALKQAGKIRAFGVCNFGPGDLGDLLDITRPTSNQMPYNLLWRGLEEEVTPLLTRHDIGLMCYSPLAQGLLTGRFASADEARGGVASSRIFSSDRDMAGHNEQGFEDEAFAVIGQLVALAGEAGVHPASLASKWLLSRPMVRTILVGARAPQEIAAIAASHHGDVISSDVIDQLTVISEPLKQRLGGNLDMWNSPGRMR